MGLVFHVSLFVGAFAAFATAAAAAAAAAAAVQKLQRKNIGTCRRKTKNKECQCELVTATTANAFYFKRTLSDAVWVDCCCCCLETQEKEQEQRSASYIAEEEQRIPMYESATATKAKQLLLFESINQFCCPSSSSSRARLSIQVDGITKTKSKRSPQQ